MRRLRLFSAMLGLLSLPCAMTAQVSVEQVFPTLTFERPVDIQNAGDGTNRLFVVEQKGMIRVFNPSSPTAEVFLDITDRVRTEGNEEGLLGLAFHPDYENNRYFYVNYVASDPRRTIIARFTATGDDPNRADPTSELKLLEVDQPFANHNAGQIRFGPDGYLYIPLGDGGSAGDPNENGQNPATLLGSMLRIDVDNPQAGMNYGIPADNPFVGNSNGWREETWAYGFRNPFRFSFDPATGWLWLGDVGQDAVEEVDVVRKGGNYGWNMMEGSGCFDPLIRCDSAAEAMGLAMPIWDYTHNLGETVIGGFVYRGAMVPDLLGKYVFADFISGRIWALEYNSDTTAGRAHELMDSELLITTFGVDESNELYFAAFDGKLYQFKGALPPDKPIGIKLGTPFPNFTFERPIELTPAYDGTDRLFVVEQKGVISVFDRKAPGASPSVFLDITDRVSTAHNEEGLLGLTFHPDYENNRYFYVYYSAANPRRSVIARFTADASDPNRADPSSQMIVLEVEQPQDLGNHKAGQIHFGSDGYLYIPLGDGGGAGDPSENGQNPATLLGSLLRIDVDNPQGGMNYGIPADNPYVGNSNGWREEAWAYGFRNPFRFSFDPQTNWLWLSDAGQDKIEEITVARKGGNHGWNIVEGSGCFNPKIRCDSLAEALNIVMPIWDYTHRNGDVVIGGYVYRGGMIPELMGHYVYADFSAGTIWGLEFNQGDTSAVENRELLKTDKLIASFGIDQDGELYVLSFDGTIYRIESTMASSVPVRSASNAGYVSLRSQPNPFGPATSLSYDLPRASHVELSIYDMLGRHLHTLVNGEQAGGGHVVHWNDTAATGVPLPAGTYLCRLKVDNQMATSEMVVIER